MAPVLEMRGIRKAFAGVRALDGVSLAVEPGEVHALCGENGAGKSTLMKVLSGVHPHGSYEGEILWEGAPCRFRDVRDSEARGLAIIHQELALVGQMTVAENIFLLDPPARLGVIDVAERYRRTRALLARVGLPASPDARVGGLGVGQQQLVEIAKALSKEPRVLILDEPTASLNERDSQALLDLLLGFKARGIASILISHKLGEVARVADRVTVLRDGRAVDTIDCRAAPAEEDRIIRAMVDRDLAHRYPPRAAEIGGEVFRVEGWSAFHPTEPDRQVVRGVDLSVRRGEVVGIAGLMGSGRTEFAMSVFGRSYGRRVSGRAFVDGEPADLSTVPRAIAAGLAYVTEDRKELGLIGGDDVRKNTVLANLGGVSRASVIDAVREIRVAAEFRALMRTRSTDVFQPVGQLSGGNQQKVVLSKWLFTGPKVLILDEPTRGIDVGAKYEIYGVINELAAGGRGVVVISSEMAELLGVCDRILVMHEGRIVAGFAAAEATQERVMRAMVGKGERT